MFCLETASMSKGSHCGVEKQELNTSKGNTSRLLCNIPSDPKGI
jgi:hypothetical protein